jgi:hypothetical protein
MAVYCGKCGVNRVEGDGEVCGCCLPPVGVGDTVICFDFPSRAMSGEVACYAVGVVEGVGRDWGGVENTCDRFKVRVVRQVFGGEEVDYTGLIFPPVNGVPIIGACGPKVTGGVVLMLKAPAVSNRRSVLLSDGRAIPAPIEDMFAGEFARAVEAWDA